MKKILLSLLLLSPILTFTSSATDVALKTNVISDAMANINIGGEIRVAPKWSVELTGDFNFWTLSQQKKWRHWIAMPEARYWLCEAMGGHFFGLHLIGGEYNIGKLNLPVNFLGTDFHRLRDSRFQGWMAGAGIGYGYSWLLHKHWSIEAEIGIGWVYSRYDRYECDGCGRKVESNRVHNYVGPTKAAINLVYVF